MMKQKRMMVLVSLLVAYSVMAKPYSPLDDTLFVDKIHALDVCFLANDYESKAARDAYTSYLFSNDFAADLPFLGSLSVRTGQTYVQTDSTRKNYNKESCEYLNIRFGFMGRVTPKTLIEVYTEKQLLKDPLPMPQKEVLHFLNCVRDFAKQDLSGYEACQEHLPFQYTTDVLYSFDYFYNPCTIDACRYWFVVDKKIAFAFKLANECYLVNMPTLSGYATAYLPHATFIRYVVIKDYKDFVKDLHLLKMGGNNDEVSFVLLDYRCNVISFTSE